ncbi:MAG: DUF72 domain-containing protein [Deltaproteobacteria bacterium]|nr:DUF72 domain-containing protein [Deltaproteobacteria bacterium]
MSNRLYIGTSGFFYKGWRGIFYPSKLETYEWLPYYAGIFNTVELNSTFYHLPKAKTVKGWIQRVPDGFVYSAKIYREITHQRLLKNTEKGVYLFLHILKPLGQKLGVFLFQLPPNIRFNKSLLLDFCKALPGHYRFSIEFRDKSWFTEETYNILCKYNVAFCISHMKKIETIYWITADFVYIRLHGPQKMYASSYSDDELYSWTLFVKKQLNKEKDVYVYFNNDFRGYAPKNALKLREFLNDE